MPTSVIVGWPGRTKAVKLTITSNGHSVAVLEDNELQAFHDIEFSLDYPTQAEQDAQRMICASIVSLSRAPIAMPLRRVRRAREKVSVRDRQCRRCRDGQNIFSRHDL